MMISINIAVAQSIYASYKKKVKRKLRERTTQDILNSSRSMAKPLLLKLLNLTGLTDTRK